MRIILVAIAAAVIYVANGCSHQISDVEKRWTIAKDSSSFRAFFRIGLDYRDSPYFDSVCIQMNEILKSVEEPHSLLINPYAILIPSIDSIPEPYKSYALASFLDTVNRCDWEFIEEDIQRLCGRNLCEIKVTKDSICFRQNCLSDETALWDSISDFFYNPQKKRHLAELWQYNIEEGKTYLVPKAIFFVFYDFIKSDKTDNGKWRNLYKTIDKILLLQEDFRGRFARRIYGKSFWKLSEKEKKYICQKFGIHVRVYF